MCYYNAYTHGLTPHATRVNEDVCQYDNDQVSESGKRVCLEKKPGQNHFRHLDMAVCFAPHTVEPVSPPEIPGGSHLSWIGVCFREEAGSEHVGDGSCIDFVVLLFLLADSLHVKGMTQVERNSGLMTSISEPVIGVCGFTTDDNIWNKGMNNFHEILEINGCVLHSISMEGLL